MNRSTGPMFYLAPEREQEARRPSPEIPSNFGGGGGAWGKIREHYNDVIKAATRLQTSAHFFSDPEPEPEPEPAIILSAVEQLPEEILLDIMAHLDHESLYRLSQTTGLFLRLSFDIVFESDPTWRAFRHTVDGLSAGPSRRILEGRKSGKGGAVVLEKPAVSVPSCEDVPGGIIEAGREPSEKRGAEGGFGDGDGDEDEDGGETMLEFMARCS